jgi:uncharacterized iron-regulated protein
MFMHLLLAVLTSAWGQTFTPAQEIVWDVKAKSWISPADVAAKVTAGEAVILGEQHATEDKKADVSLLIHHDNQLRMMSLIHATGVPVSVGMEFLPYTSQAGVDSYLMGEMDENVFRNLVNWGADAFDIYNQKILFPRASNGRTLALNMPRRITRKVSSLGPGSLTSWERNYLPPRWELGSDTYFERFREEMVGHVPERRIKNYFWAQSLWDDTMAWIASEYLKKARAQALVVVVGEFHAEFKDGLPAQMAKYGMKKVKVILQNEVQTMDKAELIKLTAPDKKYGDRADYLWFWKAN